MAATGILKGGNKPARPIKEYKHLFRFSKGKRLFSYPKLTGGHCNQRYMKTVHKTASCPFDLRKRNAYFFLKDVPKECKSDKLYREPRTVCTARPFPRLSAFKKGYVEVMRFGLPSDVHQTAGGPSYTFYYAAPSTTALFLNLTKPLVALTKLHALILLGWDFHQRLTKDTDHPGDKYFFSMVLAKTQTKKQYVAEVDRLIELMRSGAHYSTIVGTGFFDFYDFDLINDARARGHDSVVLLQEPYSGTESATEVIHLVPPHTSLRMLVERTSGAKDK